MFVAETPGYSNPKLTPEDVAANAETILAETGYIIPANVNDSARLMSSS